MNIADLLKENAKLKNQITDYEIKHVREVNKLINEVKSLKKAENALFGNEQN